MSSAAVSSFTAASRALILRSSSVRIYQSFRRESSSGPWCQPKSRPAGGPFPGSGRSAATREPKWRISAEPSNDLGMPQRSRKCWR
jgi:hypothetical protein